MTPPYVREIIEKAYEEKALFLDLGNCGLTAIPEEIQMLAPFLKELNLGSYYYIGNEYKEAKNREGTNDFSENVSCFRFLESFTSITILHLYNTGIKENLVNYIQKLTHLTSLDIRGNQLTGEGAAAIARLSNLTSLYISNNQLTDKGAAAIAGITSLTSLDIMGNQLTEKQSLELIVRKLEKLTYLSYDYDKITDLPKELSNNIKALRAYFTATKTISNTLVKMILLGNTTGGKSSLADFLIHKKYKDSRESTHGIKLWRWKTSNKKNALQVNIWDFGGQDYYHATHNFFWMIKHFFCCCTLPKKGIWKKQLSNNTYLKTIGLAI